MAKYLLSQVSWLLGIVVPERKAKAGPGDQWTVPEVWLSA
jgi:hypothetical protein